VRSRVLLLHILVSRLQLKTSLRQHHKNASSLLAPPPTIRRAPYANHNPSSALRPRRRRSNCVILFYFSGKIFGFSVVFRSTVGLQMMNIKTLVVKFSIHFLFVAVFYCFSFISCEITLLQIHIGLIILINY